MRRQNLKTCLNVTDEYNKPEKSGWPGIELQLLQVQDPRIKTTGNPAFLNVSQQIFPDPVDVIVTFPTFIEFIVKNGYAPIVKGKPIPDSIRNRLVLVSSLSEDSATPRYFYAKSFFVKKPYSADDLKEAEKVLLEMPNDSSGSWINTEQRAIAQKRSNESAYVHRDALFNMKVYLEGVDVDHVEPSKKWIQKFCKSVQFLDSGETYQNYPERDLTNYLYRYYGSNLERLKRVIRKWDPNGYFKSEVSIPID